MKKRLIGITVLLAASALIDPPASFGGQPSEYEIKGAFLYNFAKFVTWPAEKLSAPDSPIVIGILGDDPFGSVIDEIVEGKPIDGRPIRVTRFKKTSEATGVHILFVSTTDPAALAQTMKLLSPWGVLTVGEGEGFAREYGTVGFFMEENRVRFTVNVGAAERAGLKISSKLLQLARVVGTGKEDGR
jgi:hypothetical protein